MHKQNPVKILFFDIETAGVNALRSDLGFCIIFGYKWNYENKARALVIDSTSLKRFDDNNLLTAASVILSKADLTVAHYGSVFDRRFIQGRLLINNLPPIPPTKMRDTCMIARSVANFSSNRLKHLAKILNLGNQKLENNWPLAWFKVMQGDMKHLNALTEYCKGDVYALEELYYRLRPFDNAHPNIIHNREMCGACGGSVQYHGVTFIGHLKYRRYQCNACHKWSRERRAMKNG